MTGAASAAAGAVALAQGSWEQARTAFEAALAETETPAALDGMARALWWLADVEAAVGYRARAFRAFRIAGDAQTAARIAFWLAREYRSVLGNPAAANGWFTRGERLVSELPSGPAHGWLDLARAERAVESATQASYADSAYEIARRFDDPDLEIYALAARGLARINSGYVDAGIADLDAALATTTEASDLETLGDTLCSLMLAVEVVCDADRFAQWNQVLEQYVAAHQHIDLTGFCFTCCGEVFVADGRWEAADDQFKAAIAALERTGHRSRCAHPVARLARLRIRQGRLEEAEGMLAEFRELPEAVEPLAALYVSQGKPAAAVQLLDRRLAQIGSTSLPAVPLLTILVEAHVARADPDSAGRAAARLAELADRSGLARVRGHAALAAGRVARAAGRVGDARAGFDQALAAFEQAGMPMETAVVHRETAHLVAAQDQDVAAEEGRAALHGFERLGAAHEADQVAAFLRSIGVRGQTGPKGLGLLTKREREVLDLIAAGRTNAEIAERLFISPKTAGNHVSKILMKLGVRTRTEAAALALRHVAPSGR
ncbi:MAG TPA: LuxR C-terminal-related transcriptional regulator [Jiangellaceae bacterium]|nr:LuxR C-terminal-related transcriptional regulator [Jiangellaceae bacterium]